MIAAASAVALLIIMFLFDWFGNDFGGASAWQSFSIIDIILFITILAAIGAAVMAASEQSVDAPVAVSAIVAGLGILSVLLILFRIIDPPDFGTGAALDEARDQAEALGLDSSAVPDGVDIDRKIGVWLGLIASAGIAYGGFLAMQEEGTSFRDQGDRLQGSDPGTPPPAAGGPPPAV